MISKLQEKKAAEARRIAEALSAMARARQRTHHRRELMEDLLAGRDVGPWDDLPALVREVAEARRLCRKGRPRAAFTRLLLHVEAHAERLLESPRGPGQNSYVLALLRLAGLHELWIRPLEDWRPACRNPARQFGSLLRHLLARYRVPGFLDSLFFTAGPAGAEQWFHHVGTGQNIRTAPGLLVSLTKRMAHYFLEAPDHCDVVRALRWGQVVGLGGSPRLAHVLVQTNLGRQLWPREDEEWWVSVLQWLVNQPMLDPVHVGPIVDYVHYRRYEAEEPPADFSMKGRSAAALLRLVEEWHRDMRWRRKLEHRCFQPSGLRGGSWTTEKRGLLKTWSFEEILDSTTLAQEGQAMKHCVVTYIWSVQSGESSIWSMKVDQYGTPERALTVEVDVDERAIVQARGKCNRFPTPEEMQVLRWWAEQNYLTVSL